MARGRFRSTPESIAKRIAEGRGKGEGFDYRPWLEVQDFPSRGNVHRPLGWKTGREHHLFSDLEFTMFLIYDVLTAIVDIREQFPLLPLEETLEIAKRLGVKHPTDPSTRYPTVMTTDFLLKLRLNREVHFNARTVKYTTELNDPRVRERIREKFKIERIYWRRRNIDWGCNTDEKVLPGLAENAALIHPFYSLSDLYPLTQTEVRRIALYLTGRVRREELPLIEIVNDSDRKFGLEPGTSFSVACHLIGHGIWRIDLRKPIRVDEKLVLL